MHELSRQGSAGEQEQHPVGTLQTSAGTEKHD